MDNQRAGKKIKLYQFNIMFIFSVTQGIQSKYSLVPLRMPYERFVEGSDDVLIRKEEWDHLVSLTGKNTKKWSQDNIKLDLIIFIVPHKLEKSYLKMYIKENTRKMGQDDQINSGTNNNTLLQETCQRE